MTLNYLKTKILFVAFIFVSGCGMMEPKYVKYESNPTTTEGTESNGTTTDDTSGGDGCAAALTAFKATAFNGILGSGCIGCHTEGGSASPAFDGEDADQRTKLVASKYWSTDPATFVSKIKGHSGGGAAGSMEAGDITAWLAAEASCAQ